MQLIPISTVLCFMDRIPKHKILFLMSVLLGVFLIANGLHCLSFGKISRGPPDLLCFHSILIPPISEFSLKLLLSSFIFYSYFFFHFYTFLFLLSESFALTIVILWQDYMNYRKYRYLRLDGSSTIMDRRDMVRDFQHRLVLLN